MRKLGLVAACGALIVVALLLFLREPRNERREGSLTAARVEPGQRAPAPAHGEFIAPSPAATADAPPASGRETRLDAHPRAALRGRLVEAGSFAPLRAEKVLLLASPLNTVAETLRTRPDGSFTSERRFPRGLVRAWVSEPETRALLARHEAEFDPACADEWLVPVPRSRAADEPLAGAEDEVAVHGSVVDLGGSAVEGAQVKLIPLATPPGKASYTASTDAAGEFRLEELAPGPHRLLAQGRFASSAPLALVLVPGANEVGTILLPAAPGAGAVRGRLVVEGGGEDPFGVILLRELVSGKELAVTTDWSLFSDEDDGVTSFAIEHVPAGDYELCVVPIDGRAYQPEAVRVSPPAEGLEFRARGAPPRRFGLRVRDATTGAELERFVTLGRIRGQWYGGDLGAESQLPDGFDRWVVYAEGYRPAQGDFSGARRVRSREAAGDEGEECEVLEVEVALQPGHGLALLFKDSESDRLLAPEFEDLIGPGLPGVIVLADGEPAARSDPDGLALLDLPRAPAELSFARAGWRVVGEREAEGLQLVHMARE